MAQTTDPKERDASKPPDWDGLFQRAIDGDRLAFREIVERTQIPVQRVTLRVIGTPADAEEATQETYLRAWQQLHRFQFRSSPVTWLCRIAMNVSIDFVRKRKRERERFVLGTKDDSVNSWIEELPSTERGADEKLELTQLRQQISQAMEAMKPAYRLVFSLREIDELSYEEIAEILDCPVGTVESRMHRARKSFRKEMRKLAQRKR